ncbi:hypothetical protein [Streptomyces sp. NPDC052721]|uniref:hypothetical protein n=1 Tax=Streptomyces sp. NPDC052721 TaxID=3154955 RepID=UPI00343192C5
MRLHKEPASDGTTAYLMSQQVADAIVRLEERNIRADGELAVAQIERGCMRQVGVGAGGMPVYVLP